MARLKKFKKYPLQVFTIVLCLFTLYLSLYILSQQDLGFYAHVATKVSSILSNPFTIIGGVLGINNYLWDVWKKIPISIHVLISFLYLFLIGMLIPVSYQKIKDDYGKPK